MTISKFDLLFYLVIWLFDIWPGKTMDYWPLPWYITEPILVVVCLIIHHISCNIQTDKPLNEHTCQNKILASNKRTPLHYAQMNHLLEVYGKAALLFAAFGLAFFNRFHRKILSPDHMLFRLTPVCALRLIAWEKYNYASRYSVPCVAVCCSYYFSYDSMWSL